jgi:hypothetical protein
MTDKFDAQVDAWVRKSNKRMLAIMRESAKRVAIMTLKTRGEGGNMRVDTGFLRASFQSSLTAMPKIDINSRPNKNRTYAPDSAFELNIGNAHLGNTIYMGFTAGYARPREYKDGFVRLAAQKWSGIVKQVTKEAKARVNG